MTDEFRKRGLGRGLSALLGEAEESAPAPAAAGGGVRSVPIDRLHPGRYQPRRAFDEESMAALVESVAAQGILQPLLVRPHPRLPGEYEILAGERRWRAAQRAQLHEVPVLLREIDDRAALEIALVENVQREDLKPLEEAQGYQRLIAEFGHTQEALAKRIGKSRSHVANTLRLLNLPEEVRAMLEDGRLTAGHARALLTAIDPLDVAQYVVRHGLSVRQTEAMCRPPPEPVPVDSATLEAELNRINARDANIRALERELREILGLRVEIKEGLAEHGSLTITYRSYAQLEGVLAKLRAKEGR